MATGYKRMEQFSGASGWRVWGVILLVVLLAGCRWENPNAEKNEEEREEVDEAIQGSWRSLCQIAETEEDQDEIWLRTRYEFSGSAVTRTNYEYPDSSCLDADLIIEYRGDFDLAREATADDGQQVNELDLDYSDVEVTAGDASVPPTPGRRYDILYLRDDESGFFLGKKDETQDGTEKDKRPTVVDFSDEYLKQ